MILIPEIETVVVLVPRTGSGTLRRIVAHAYLRSTLIYRHMEADGVPAGYDRWRRVGVVRHPVDRLWSLYNFLRQFGGDHDPAYIAAQRASVARSFDEWLVENQTVFTSPYDSAGLGRFWPQFTVRHPMPETKKSQFIYLRPDLGTYLYHYENLHALALDLGVDLGAMRQNQSGGGPRPILGRAARDHVERFFAWDFEVMNQSQRVTG